MADDEPHSEVEYALSQHDAVDQAELLHSTSWRVDGPRLVLTYIAVMHIPALARDAWPDAQPVSLDLVNAVGKPLPYTPTEPPTPRYIDVLFHALRHLRFLLDTDATSAQRSASTGGATSPSCGQPWQRCTTRTTHPT